MKLSCRIVTLMIFALIWTAGIGGAMAICGPPKTFGTWDRIESAYYYVYGYNNDGTGVGAFWEPGFRVGANEGTIPLEAWLRVSAEYGGYIIGNWGDSRVVGCPQNGAQTVIALTQGDGSFAIGQSEETPASFHHWMFGNFTFTFLPQPQVDAVNWSGTDLVLDLHFATIDAGYSSLYGTPITEMVRSINLYCYVGVSDPGRDTSLYTLHSRIPYTGGVTTAAGITLDCSNPDTAYFLASGLDLTNEYDTVHVSTAAVVACSEGADRDGDGFANAFDNCPYIANEDQLDVDDDGFGDACDICPDDPFNDLDSDGICGDLDNCPAVANTGQQDQDLDGVGDGCDNCIATFNIDQADIDADGAGDACDPFPNRPDNYMACLEEREVCLDDMVEGHAGLAEIKRLLGLPVGKRSSSFMCSGELCPDIMKIIEMLLDSPEQCRGD